MTGTGANQALSFSRTPTALHLIWVSLSQRKSHPSHHQTQCQPGLWAAWLTCGLRLFAHPFTSCSSLALLLCKESTPQITFPGCSVHCFPARFNQFRGTGGRPEDGRRKRTRVFLVLPLSVSLSFQRHLFRAASFCLASPSNGSISQMLAPPDRSSDLAAPALGPSKHHLLPPMVKLQG